MPLFVGVAAVVFGVLGLLLTATAGVIFVVLAYHGTGSDPGGDSSAPGFFAGVSVLACVGLLGALALLVGGKDAGRSATVWLAGVTLPWVLAMGFFFALVLSGDDFGERSHRPALLGLAGAGLAALGLLVGAILLGIRPGRRWLAHRILSGDGRIHAGAAATAEPPAPLYLARRRFSVALLVVFAAGVGFLVFLPLSALGSDPDLAGTVFALAVLLLVFVNVPLLVAVFGAGSARAGRRRGAAVARVFSAVPMFVLSVFAALSVFAGVVSLIGSPEQISEATLPPAAALALSGVFAVAFLAGIGLVVAGLATLADPRTEQHLRGR